MVGFGVGIDVPRRLAKETALIAGGTDRVSTGSETPFSQGTVAVECASPVASKGWRGAPCAGIQSMVAPVGTSLHYPACRHAECEHCQESGRGYSETEPTKDSHGLAIVGVNPERKAG